MCPLPQIELLGLARRYAGVGSVDCLGTTLEQVLRDLGTKRPEFASRCIPGELLPPGLIVCVNERRFTTAWDEPIRPNDRVLILSADVGG